MTKLYPKAEIEKYGLYGKETIALVKKFQKEEGLNPDGDFGQQTLLALDRLLPKLFKAGLKYGLLYFLIY